MTCEEILDHTLDMLQRRGRVSYRALQRQFGLDDAYLSTHPHSRGVRRPLCADPA